MLPKVTAAAQVQQLDLTLQRALAKKAELLEQLDVLNATIKAARECMSGIKTGQQLEREVIAEREKAAEKDRLAEELFAHTT